MSTSVATLTTNFFPSAENGFTTTTSGSVSSGASTVGLNSVAGYSNGEVAVFVIDPTDPTKKQTFTGVVDTSGSQITSVVWTAGSNTTHALGATVVDYATATHISMISKGVLVEHNQDGTHSDVTADSLATNTITEGTAASGVTVDGVLLKDGKVATAGAVENTAVMVGMPVQVVSVTYSSADSVTGASNIIPNDDTIPQNTEGKEFMSLSITPKSATNILVIQANTFLSNGNATQILTTALFQDSTANALAVSTMFTDANTATPHTVPLQHAMVAGTTSATTFKIRGGSHQSTTTTFNGVSGSRSYGAIPKSSIVITEYKAA